MDTRARMGRDGNRVSYPIPLAWLATNSTLVHCRRSSAALSMAVLRALIASCAPSQPRSGTVMGTSEVTQTRSHLNADCIRRAQHNPNRFKKIAFIFVSYLLSVSALIGPAVH